MRIRAAASMDPTPTPATEALVRTLVGSAVRRLERLDGRGITNTKLFCERQDGERLLIRVNETAAPEVGLGRFQKAAFCSRACLQQDVPAPAVLEVGTLPNGRPYALERWVDNALPADLVRDRAERVRIWQDLGRAIRAVHATPLGGQEHHFPLGYDGEGPTATWTAHLAAIRELLASDPSLGLSGSQKTRLLSELERLDLARYPPGLTHGDLKLDNVLLCRKTLAVQAIVDWELARFVPAPLGEFSTSTEPAVLKSKQFAVARGEAERDAFLRGLGYGPEEARDFLLFFMSDVLVNVAWYQAAIRSERPDVQILRRRFTNYLAGIRDDVERVKQML